MVDVQSRLADLREEAYAKVLRCLPYPRQWGTEMLITSLRNEFGIIDEVHEEILDAVMTNTERPAKRQRLSSSYSQGPGALDMPAGSELIRTGSSGAVGSEAPVMHGMADTMEQAKPKAKPQKAPSRFAAAGSDPARLPKKRKEREAGVGHAEPMGQQTLTADEIAQGCKLDPLIGMRVKRWWPEDGGWFEGVVTDFRITDQQHCITYNFNQADESFEWYNLKQRNQDECKLLKGRVDVLAASHQATAKASGQNGLRKTGSGRGFKKGRHSAGGGRGPNSQRMSSSYQPQPAQHQAPVAHKFQVVSDDDDYGVDDISDDDGGYGL